MTDHRCDHENCARRANHGGEHRTREEMDALAEQAAAEPDPLKQRPLTAAIMQAIWDERDNRYSVRRINGHPAPLTDDEASHVADRRRVEVDLVVPPERVQVFNSWMAWQPPVVKR
jgi:hypothetical protein